MQLKGAPARWKQAWRRVPALRPLQTGLRRANVKVIVSAERVERKVDRLRRSSPGIFDSGYFVLSALQGAPPEGSRNAPGGSSTSNTAARPRRSSSIPRYTFNTTGSLALNERLKQRRRPASRRRPARRPG